MLRQFIRSLIPNKAKLVRTVGSTGEPNNTFQRNAVSKEEHISSTLRRFLPGITYISVEDISGGCGAMYEISIEATEFSGLSRVKQHQLVTDALKTEISEMHGIRIHTTPPATNS